MSGRLGTADHVMFGHSALFGDYVDIIHAGGGCLKKVVANIPDIVRASDGRRFTQDLAAMNKWLAARPDGRPIPLQWIDDFRPEPGESYVIGFRGRQMGPLLDRLRQAFGLTFASLRHPSSVVSPTAEIGEGAIIGAGCIIGSFASLGEFCLLNRGATIGHNARIEAFATVGPGVDIASGVSLGQGVAIGIGATILEGLSIGAGAFVGAGALVSRDVEPDAFVAGAPARRTRRTRSDTPV
jgi:sugar O-acyltransferase (sialic acid O-acetyltransferase NeuD family)